MLFNLFTPSYPVVDVNIPEGWWKQDAQLDLDFANKRAYNKFTQFRGRPDSILTYTSPSPKLVYGDDGVLRYAPHNLHIQSAFASGWTSNGATLTPNSTTAPDGTQTAALMTGVSGTFQVYQTPAVSPNTQYTLSVYVKQGTSPTLRLDFVNTATGPIFTFATKTWSSASGFTTGYQELGDGWYRLWVSRLSGASAAGGVGLVVSGTTTAYVWGAQLSNGVTLFDYIPTTSAAVYSLPIDHDPITHAPLGVLIEEQRTNLLTYSEEFDNANWPKNNATVTANAEVAPNGTTTADLMYPTTTGSNRRLLRGTGTLVTGLTVYTQSIFVKSAGFQWVHLNATAAATAADSVWFDIINGVTGTVGANATATSITDVGNGWFRITVSGPASTTAGNNYFYLCPTDADNSYVATTSGTSGIFIWGAQLEAGAFPTSYIPTVASQVTRAADHVSILTSAFGYNAAESSVVVDVKAATNIGQDIFWIANGLAESLAIYTNSTGNVLNWTRDGGVNQAVYMLNGSHSGTFKAAAAYKENDFAGSLNGAAVATDTSGTMPTPTDLKLGPRSIASGSANLHIKRLTYFSTRKSNAELQGLSA